MKPLFSWINRRSYIEKFIAIGLLFVLALTGFYPMGRDQLLRREQYGIKELEGTFYLRPLQTLLADVGAYHLLAIRAEEGENVDQQLRLVENDINTNLAEARDLHALYSESLLLTNELDLVEAQWQLMQTAVAQQDHEAIEETFFQISDQIRQLIRRVGDTSFLILDPDLDTYYMMDASLLKLPELQGLLNETSEIVFHAVVDVELSVQDRLQLIALGEQVQSNLDELATGMATSWENDLTGEMRPLTQAPLQALQADVSDYFDLINVQLVSADPIAPQPELNVLKERIDESLAAYYNGASEALEFGIGNRIDRFTSRLIYAIGIAVVSIGVAMFVGVLLLRSISRPLQELTAAASRLGAGDFDVRVKASGEDEASRVGQAFNRMATELEAQVDTLSQLTKALEASGSISRQLSTILEVNQLVVEVVESLQQTFGYYHVHIYLLDDQTNQLILRGGTGEVSRIMLAANHQIAVGQGLVGRSAGTQQSVFVPNVALDQAWLPNPLLPGTKSEVAVPISLGEQLLGVLDVQHDLANGLTTNDVSLLEAIASQVAVALRNARLFTQAQEQAHQESVVNEIGEQIRSAANVEMVLQIAARELAQKLGTPRASIEISRGMLTGNGRITTKTK